MEATQTVALRAAAGDRSVPRRDDDVASEHTIPAQFVAASRTRGTQTAMRWKRRGIWEEVTWSDYGAAVREVGCALLAFGLRRGDRVAIVSDNRPEWLYVDLGAQSAGYVSVGIDVSESTERVADVLNTCGARVLFVDSAEQLDAVIATMAKTPALECIVQFDARIARVETNVRVADFAGFRGDGRQFDKQHPGRWGGEIDRVRAEDVATMVCEQGSGTALVTHCDLARQMDAIDDVCPGLAGDEQLSVLPLSHARERCYSAYRPLAVGSIVNFGEGPDNLVDGLREVAPHVVMATSEIFERLHQTVAAAIADASPLGRLCYRMALDAKPDSFLARLLVLNRVKTMVGLRRARVLLCSGAAMPPALLRWYRALGLQVADMPRGEDWRPSGASDTLVHKESR